MAPDRMRESSSIEPSRRTRGDHWSIEDGVIEQGDRLDRLGEGTIFAGFVRSSVVCTKEGTQNRVL